MWVGARPAPPPALMKARRWASRLRTRAATAYSALTRTSTWDEGDRSCRAGQGGGVLGMLSPTFACAEAAFQLARSPNAAPIRPPRVSRTHPQLALG